MILVGTVVTAAWGYTKSSAARSGSVKSRGTPTSSVSSTAVPDASPFSCHSRMDQLSGACVSTSGRTPAIPWSAAACVVCSSDSSTHSPGESASATASGGTGIPVMAVRSRSFFSIPLRQSMRMSFSLARVMAT